MSTRPTIRVRGVLVRVGEEFLSCSPLLEGDGEGEKKWVEEKTIIIMNK